MKKYSLSEQYSKNLILSFLLIFFLNSARSQNFTSTNLPIVIITTDLNSSTGRPLEILDNPRVLASMKIIKRPDGSRNNTADSNIAQYLDYSGRISIEIRGSSSQSLPKKPYGFTTLKANNTSNDNVSLLGMPKENDWVLNSLAYDPSCIRDYLSYNLSRQMGNYATRTEYCEVVVNGEYKGLYILQEKIKADENRVNVVKMDESDNMLPNLSGGYITKADKTTGGDPVAWSMTPYKGTTVNFIHDLPKPENITGAQHTFIKKQFLDLEAKSKNSDAATGYPSIIDVPSFIDFMIVCELSSNVDSYQNSTFFHKDRNGKLRAGPVWDFNLTYGNNVFHQSRTNVWEFSNSENQGAKFWTDLFNNSMYKCYLSKRWNELTKEGGVLNYYTIVQFIDKTIVYINEAIKRDHQKWGKNPNNPIEINNIRTFLYNRINWMTAQLGSYAACDKIQVPPLVITKINYNPGTSASSSSDELEFIAVKNTGNEVVNLTGVYLKELGLSYQFAANSTLAAGSTIYIAARKEAFLSNYGSEAFGQFSGNLSNKSKKIILADAFGNTIDSVEYFNTAPWPEADGNGKYLELTSTALDNSKASSWKASNEPLAAADFIISKKTDSSSWSFAIDEPVILTDASSGKFTFWKWKISKGGSLVMTSSAQNIQFANTSIPGVYFVEFTASNGNISSTKTGTFTIRPFNYCQSKGLQPIAYIQNIQIGIINNKSAHNTPGYSDFTNFYTDLPKNKTHTITIKQYRPRGPVGCAVFIDYNRNGIFDASEVVWSRNSLNYNETSVKGTFIVPHTAKNGLTRMRVSLRHGGIPSPCDINIYGEVEDYTVIINNNPKGKMALNTESSTDNRDVYQDVEFSPGLTENGLITEPLTDAKDLIHEIYLSPNPTNSILNVTPVFKNATFRIYDLAGKMITKGQIENEIDVSFLQSGSYIFQIFDNNVQLKSLHFVKK